MMKNRFLAPVALSCLVMTAGDVFCAAPSTRVSEEQLKKAIRISDAGPVYGYLRGLGDKECIPVDILKLARETFFDLGPEIEEWNNIFANKSKNKSRESDFINRKHELIQLLQMASWIQGALTAKPVMRKIWLNNAIDSGMMDLVAENAREADRLTAQQEQAAAAIKKEVAATKKAVGHAFNSWYRKDAGYDADQD
jgi:hypothetical protein